MSTAVAVILLAAGLVVLWKSADLLVSGAVHLANKIGISPFVIGLTVVAMGTSAPEMAASIAAVVRGAGNVALGNVYGSNIANLLLVGGLAGLVRPIDIKKQTMRREIPAMLLAGLLLWPALHNLAMSRLEGIGLFAVFVIMLLLTIKSARSQKAANGGITVEMPKMLRSFTTGGLKLSLIIIIVGLAGLAIGADMTVRGAVEIGGRIGLSQAVIGLTIIAVGTSLPELATCIMAAIKGHSDISAGNLIGSNIFNTLLVTGTAGMIRPFEFVRRLAVSDYWIMLFISIGFVILVVIGRHKIGRFCGTILLVTYAAYLSYLFFC